MNSFTKQARSLVGVTLLLTLVLVAACGGDEYQSQSRQDRPTPADATQDPHAGHNHGPAADGSQSIAGITFAAPDAWTSLGASGMRQAQFQLPATADDAAPAEVNVFYFGPQSGGGVEANLQRWIGQMTADADQKPVRSTFTADGMNGHLISLDGAYKAGSMRPMGGDSGEAKPGYRLVGVVLEGPQGSLFFKLTGPAATARAMEDGLIAMVTNAKKAS